ncbi:MAG: hydrogenase iron-sulfur subunit [Desulfocucumaceae bacterium]
MEPAIKEGKDFVPKILAFSTNNISDPGIDLAGSSHMHYSPSVVVISLPCSSGIRPGWVLYAIEKGFDGVYIAADGTDCSYLQDCVERTSRIAGEAQDLLREKGHDPRRVKMAAVCSVCSEHFANHMKEYSEVLKKIGPARKGQ